MEDRGAGCRIDAAYEAGRKRPANLAPMDDMPANSELAPVLRRPRLQRARRRGSSTKTALDIGSTSSSTARRLRSSLPLRRAKSFWSGNIAIRPALVLWEVPAGSANESEIPIDGARRELHEETGYSAGRIRQIGSFWTSPGFCSELMHFFHADELVAGEPSFDDDERIEIKTFSIDAAWRLVANGRGGRKNRAGPVLAAGRRR